MDNAQAPDETLGDDTALPSALAAQRPEHEYEQEHGHSEHLPGHWRYELRRWLATLNPGRTGREYEKAVTYFFATRGVPQEVSAVSFDLLLAYRGALALRAADPARGAHHPPAARHASTTEAGSPYGALPASGSAAPLLEDRGVPHTARDADTIGDSAESEGSGALTPLAPATVNIRLTALRQFLVHCAMVGTVTTLSPDRIRMALKRLTIDRRRPYQVLAESEWEGFLAAAALPAKLHPSVAISDASAASQSVEAEPTMSRSPWGVPRAARANKSEQHESPIENAPGGDPRTTSASPAPLARSRAGLTGIRTAQRDHALIALALATGLRAIELSLLDLGDLTREWHDGQEEWWLVLPDAKTKGQHGGRTLPLATPLVTELLAYIRATDRRLENASDRSTPLFMSSRGVNGAHSHASARGRLTAGQIGRIVDRIETQWIQDRETSSGETRAISPHALRHSTAMALLEGSADGARPPASVEHVRGWLGHFDIRTTQGYLAHLDSRRHRRSLRIALPVDTPSTPDDPIESSRDDGDAQ